MVSSRNDKKLNFSLVAPAASPSKQQLMRNLHFAAGHALLALALISSSPSIAAGDQSASPTEPRSLKSVRFEFKADGAVRGGFALSSGRLYFGTEAGNFYSLNAKSGSPVWQTTLGSGVASVPAVGGATVYATSWDNVLHALDTSSGRERWRRPLGQDIGTVNYWDFYTSSPVLKGGTIYVGSGDGRMSAIDAQSGRVTWSVSSGARIRTTPAISETMVAFGTTSGHVIALDRQSGRQLWDFATVGAAQDFSLKDNDTRSVVTAPLIAGGLVVAGGRDGNIYGIDQSSGKERWRETHDGGSWILGLAAEGKRLYSTSGSALIIQATDLATGKEIWRTNNGGALFGGLAKAGDVLVSNVLGGTIVGLDTRGTKLWRAQLSQITLATPLIADGAVFTGSDDGSVTAFEGSSAPPIEFDRMVYSFTNPPAASNFWFNADATTALNAGFAGGGYKRIGNAELVKALAAGGDPKRKIIVIADTRLPDGVDGAMVRAFLNAGGTIVSLGPDPLAYTYDPKTGEPLTVDDAAGAAAVGMRAVDPQLDYGYNRSRFTPGAGNYGLVGGFTSSGQLRRPAEVSLVLATDRLGMASAWAQQFAKGGLLVHLPVPRNRPFQQAAYLNAIDFLANRSARSRIGAK
ncbi:MAG: PQQ-binding-like beta-propeller repeat protein [Sphingomicrobium sp.]